MTRISVTDSAYALEIPESVTSNTNRSRVKARKEVNLLPFIETDPELWFALADGTFAMNGVQNEQKKFILTLEVIGVKYAQLVRDEILKAEETKKYDYNSLKRELLQKMRDEMIERLATEEIGDQSPKEFLQHLKSIASFVMPESTLQIMWRRKLPTSIQKVLEILPNRELSKEADTAQITWEILAKPEEKKKDPNVDEILKRVDSMALEIEQLKRRILDLEGADDDEAKMVKRPRHQTSTKSDAETPTKELVTKQQTTWKCDDDGRDEDTIHF